MKNLFLFSCLLVSSFFVASCDKDDDSKNETKRDLLIKKSCWKLTKFEGKENDVYTDLTNFFFDDCDLDNCYNFKSDGKFEVTEGPTKCDPSDPNIYDTGTWSLNADFTTFTVTSEDLEVTNAKVVSLTGDTFTIEGDTDLGTMRMTFK